MLKDWTDEELTRAAERLRAGFTVVPSGRIIEAVTVAADTRARDEGIDGLIERAAIIVAAIRAA